MKKLVCLVLALCLLLCAGGAMADKLPDGNGTITDIYGNTATWCTEFEEHSEHDDGKDYCYYKTSNIDPSTGQFIHRSYLYVLNSGLTISGFNSANSSFEGITIEKEGVLTLDNVNIDVSGIENAFAVYYSKNGDASLTLNLNKTTLKGHSGGVHVAGSGEQGVGLTVAGNGTIVCPANSPDSSRGIHVQNNGTGSVSCTLGGNLALGGNGKAVTIITNSSGAKSLNIDGKTYQGIMLRAGDNPTDAEQIGIYDSLVNVYGVDEVQNAKYIATQTASAGGVAGGMESEPMYGQTADLPQTGDHSSLALWALALALAGAGMLARKNREA